MVLLEACTGGYADDLQPASRSIINGPAADYPMVLGDPYDIDGVQYEPRDTLNYDVVGYASVDGMSDAGITVAHKTLPMPSYVEVTSLDSGRTILARVERRGPMSNTRVLSMSEAAASQLGVSDGAPVRVRRVNPLEADRAELRAGAEAPMRMTTPRGLVDILRKRLPLLGATSLADPRQAQISGRSPDAQTMAKLDAAPQPVVEVTPQPAPAVAEQPAAAVAPPLPPKPAAVTQAPVAAEGRFVVQLGAFAVRSNADRLANKTGGHIVQSGKLALVRVGPFANRGQAEAALAKLRAQGYSDALITVSK